MFENLSGVSAEVLDRAGGKLSWISSWGFIGQANLDGSDPKGLITGLLNPNELAMRPDAGKLY